MRFSLAIAAIFVATACSPPSDVLQDDRVTGPYRIRAVDSFDYRMLAYEPDPPSSVGMVGPTVIGVGYDDRYVVVARRPLQDYIKEQNEFTGRTDPATNFRGTAFYIINRSKDHRFADQDDCACKEGPLTKEQLDRRAVELKLPSIRYL